MITKKGKIVRKNFCVAAVIATLGSPVFGATFTLGTTGACGISAPTVSGTLSLSGADSRQCNNLSQGAIGNLLGSRNVGFDHQASHAGIASGVRATTKTTDLNSFTNTGASMRIDTTSATDTLSFSGGPSEFEAMVVLDYSTSVSSTVSSASFVNFSLGVARIGGSGGIASDNFRVVDYATANSQEIFRVDPIKILINQGATLNLSAALNAQATSFSLAGQNDNDEALAKGSFTWSIFAPKGVQISSTSGFDYNTIQPMAAVPLPSSILMMFSALGLLGLGRRMTGQP